MRWELQSPSTEFPSRETISLLHVRQAYLKEKLGCYVVLFDRSACIQYEQSFSFHGDSE
jgi:hypothetical protein